MAKKQIIITLTNPRPCKFDGQDLEVQVELMPTSIRALSDLVRDLLGQLVADSEIELVTEPRVRFTLNADHYYGYVIIEVAESAEYFDMGLRTFFAYLFDKGQAGIFERNHEFVSIPGEAESIIREGAEKAKALLGGTVLAEEISVLIDDKPICTVAGKIQRPSPKTPIVNPVPKLRSGSISGFCTCERVVYFVENNVRTRVGYLYDPAHYHELVSRICLDVMNQVEIVTEERLTANRRVVEIIVAVKEVEKDRSSLF